jgi:hypothetical protein
MKYLLATFAVDGPAYHCPNDFPIDAKYEEASMTKVQQLCKRKQFYIESADKFDPHHQPVHL